MTSSYKPLVTNLNAIQETEKNIYSEFVGVGYAEEQAIAVAHTFTQFTLGYLTAKGAAQKLLAVGLSERVVRQLIELFQAANEQSAPEQYSIAH